MKKTVLFVVIMMLALVLVSCADKGENPESLQDASSNIESSANNIESSSAIQESSISSEVEVTLTAQEELYNYVLENGVKSDSKAHMLMDVLLVTKKDGALSYSFGVYHKDHPNSLFFDV